MTTNLTRPILIQHDATPTKGGQMNEERDLMVGNPREFIRQSTIAEDLGVNRSTIGSWMDKGHFPYILVAGKRRVTRELYRAWILENTEPGVGPGG